MYDGEGSEEEDGQQQRYGTTSGTREVITLQVGSLANFVGAHYWNFQDELWGYASDQPGGALPDPYDPAVMFATADGGRTGARTIQQQKLQFSVDMPMRGLWHPECM
jgi:Misato Segment II tubulin-like domain